MALKVTVRFPWSDIYKGCRRASQSEIWSRIKLREHGAEAAEGQPQVEAPALHDSLLANDCSSTVQ